MWIGRGELDPEKYKRENSENPLRLESAAAYKRNVMLSFIKMLLDLHNFILGSVLAVMVTNEP